MAERPFTEPAEPGGRPDKEQSPLTKLVKKLRNQDLQLRLDAIQTLPGIARVLGPERTRSKLIPMLLALLDDKAEVRVVLAEQLGALVPLVGRDGQAVCLLPPLLQLAEDKDPLVRDGADESLRAVVRVLPKQVVEEDLVPQLRCLSLGNRPSSRSSICGVFPAAYLRATDSLPELRALFRRLSRDASSMVRRSMARHLPEMAWAIEPGHLKAHVITMLMSLLRDEKESVRVCAVGALAGVAAAIRSLHDRQKIIVPLICRCSSDSSLRVRCALADEIGKLQSNLGAMMPCPELARIYSSLLRDSQFQVRLSAASKLRHFCLGLNPATRETVVFDTLLDAIKNLTCEDQESAKVAVGAALMWLAVCLPQQRVLEQLSPLVVRLMRAKRFQVTLCILDNFERVSVNIDPRFTKLVIVPFLQELLEDNQWRTRLRTVELMPCIARNIGVQDIDLLLKSLFLPRLEDKVCEVRKGVVKILPLLVVALGHEWSRDVALPAILKLVKNRSYLHRMTVLFATNELHTIMDRRLMTEELLPIVISLAYDKVPNVRFCAAKTLGLISSQLEMKIIERNVVPILQKLCCDADRDVKYFATEALKSVILRPAFKSVPSCVQSGACLTPPSTPLHLRAMATVSQALQKGVTEQTKQEMKAACIRPFDIIDEATNLCDWVLPLSVKNLLPTRQ